MSASVADIGVRTYLDAVRAHLDDLPEDERNELLEDLEQHLLEVAAEDDASLEERLGPPAAYAEELRVSAGLPSREQLAARGVARRIGDKLATSTWIRRADSLRENEHVRALLAFLEECRPGWWVARGYLAVLAGATIVNGIEVNTTLFPVVSGSGVIGGLIAVAAIGVSVWLGRRAQKRKKGRALSVLITAGVIASTAAVIGGAGWGPAYAYPDESSVYQPPFLHHADGNTIANLCPYSSDGKLLTGVLLFDQDGRPVINIADYLPDGRPAARKLPAILNAYPQAIDVPDEVGNAVPLTCPSAIGVAPKAPGPAVASPAGTP